MPSEVRATQALSNAVVANIVIDGDNFRVIDGKGGKTNVVRAFVETGTTNLCVLVSLADCQNYADKIISVFGSSAIRGENQGVMVTIVFQKDIGSLGQIHFNLCQVGATKYQKPVSFQQ